MSRMVHVVVNPASGQPKPILHTLNQVFRKAQVDWDISLTHKSGDAERFARQAAEAGADVVAAYGGDGTVMEVARGLFGTKVPLAILPGGTANLMSVELGIPKELDQAAAIAADSESLVRQIDVGMFGDTYFLLRVGMGFAAEKVKQADRQLKDRWGLLAYSIAGIKALKQSKTAHYRLTLDGQEVEVNTRSLQVYNAGNMGKASARPAKNISVEDGLLDLLAVRETAISTVLTRGADLSQKGSIEELFDHWQARQIQIQADPPQMVQVDGEIVGETPVTLKVFPQFLPILTPAQP